MVSYAEDLLMAQLEDQVISFFPTTMTCDAKITTDKVVCQIQRAKATRACEALPIAFTKELNTIIGTLTDLGNGGLARLKTHLQVQLLPQACAEGR